MPKSVKRDHLGFLKIQFVVKYQKDSQGNKKIQTGTTRWCYQKKFNQSAIKNQYSKKKSHIAETNSN